MLREERDRKSTRNNVETVTALASVTSSNLSAAGPCAHATQARATAGRTHRGSRRAVWRGSGRQPGRRAACKSPGSASSRGMCRVFALRLTAPLTRVCSSGGAQPRHMPLLPASRWHRAGRGAARLRPAQSSPAGAGLLCAAGSAACAPASPVPAPCDVIWPPTAPAAFPPSRATRPACCHSLRSLPCALAWRVRTVGGKAPVPPADCRRAYRAPAWQGTARRPSPVSSYASVIPWAATSPA